MKKFREIVLDVPSVEEVQAKAGAFLQSMAMAKDANELFSIIDNFEAFRRKLMTFIFTCHVRDNLDVNDEDLKKSYNKAMQIFPMIQVINAQFYGVLMASPFKDEVKTKYGKRIFEIADAQMKTMSAKIVPLMQEEFMLANEYNKVVANGSFEFMGKTMGFVELQLYMESKDREIRKEAYKLWSDFFEKNEQCFDEIYDKLVKNRTAQAVALGYKTYTEYAYDKLNRTDYTQEDVAKFREGIRKYIVPLNEKMKEAQSKRIGVDSLKYYDETAKFATSNAHPLGDSNFMLGEAKKMFNEMSDKTGEYFNQICEREFYDLDARQGKKQGGFCVPLVCERLPFVFCNFNGTSHDLKVLVHEAGHGFQTYSCLDKPLFEYTFCTYETGEVHSMSMEFLAWKWTEQFMGENTLKYKYTHLIDALAFMPYGSTMDEFQHVVYNNPDMTPAERKQAFAEIEIKYAPSKDYDENEFLKKGTLWYKQPHLFNNAFYYIDYVLAELCALQIWEESLKDWQGAFDKYDKFCSIGGELAFTEVLAEAGFKNPFNEKTIESVATKMSEYLATIDDSKL